MIRLLFIVPYPELREKVEYVLDYHPEKKNLNVDVQVMTVEEAPDVLAEKYDAIIARGYTARETAKMYTQIPTIGLTVSGYDIIRAMSECCERYHPKKIAICGLNGQMFEAESISKFFGVEAKVYMPQQHGELYEHVNQAIQDGCDAIIGGYSANIVAKEKGVNAVVIRTGEDTIYQAIDEAVHTVEQIRHERLIAQMYKTIIYTSKAGVLYVDSKGKILVRNRVVRSMNGEISLLNRPLKEVLPYLYKIFKHVMSTGTADIGRIITIPETRTTVSIDTTPVIANEEISGVVINLSDITIIQDLESQIRRKLSERGLKAKYKFEDIQHQSKTMEQTIETARRYAASDSNVIIVGETGTGKELFAQSIHNASSRRHGPFVAINCAALPENLLESELFGYVEGAFTGTSKGGKMGLFEQAHGGTLFLDEIGEVTMPIQSKLLRVLQEKQVRRIGDNKVIDINVRVISATNKSISKMAEQGLFRKDLMYRLDVLRLFIPPLRKRQNDVEMLFLNLLKQQSREMNISMPEIAPDAMPLLHQYPFLGNIRELKNIVERVCALMDGEVITRENFQEALYPQDLEMEPTWSLASALEEPITAESEPERIQKALQQCGGNRTKAAKLLNMDRSTLWRKMKNYQL